MGIEVEASGAAIGVSWGYRGVTVGIEAEDICDDMEGMNPRRGTWFPPCCRYGTMGIVTLEGRPLDYGIFSKDSRKVPPETN